MKPNVIDLGGAALVAGIVVSAWIFGIRGPAARLEEVRSRELAMHRELASTGTLTERQAQMNRNLDILTKALADYERRMPPSPQVDGFVRQLYQAAKRAGFSITSVQPGAPIDRERYSALPVEVQGSGEFPDFYAFLYEMREVPRINRVEHFSLARQGQGTVAARVVFQIFMSGKRA